MIAIIRIKGKVGISGKIKATLDRLRIKQKYACVVVRETPIIKGMLEKVRDYVAYGKIDSKTFVKLIEKRGQPLSKKKIDSKKIADEFIKSEDKKLSDLGIKDFFRLHPPRGGIKTKFAFPRGVLGNNKEKINDLIKRML